MVERPDLSEELSKREKFIGFLFLGFGIVGPLATLIIRRLVFHGPKIYYDSALHAAMEAFGAALALLTGTILYLLRRQFHWSHKFCWAACSLVSLGSLSMVQSIFTREGNILVGAEVIAAFVGGVFAVLCWLPERWQPSDERSGRMVVTAFLFSVATGFALILFGESFPHFLNGTQFNSLSATVSGTSGILFLLASAKFFIDFKQMPRAKNLFIGDFFLLTGVSTVFPLSYVPWGPLWWSWHGLQLIAYLAVCILIGGLAIRLEQRLAASEAQQRRLSEELYRTNADLERFAHVASHDLQEPLRMIAIYLSLIQEKAGASLDGQSASMLSGAKAGAERSRLLVADLLKFSQYRKDRLDAHELEAVDLETVVSHLRENLTALITENDAEITTSPLPVVRAKTSLIADVLQNLVANAIKYRGERRPLIQIIVSRLDSEWIISVRDNGMGINAQYLGTIFEPFRRLHGREIPGSGMGLATCRRIVERLGGKIWVESEVGVGSLFSFSLPVFRAVSDQENQGERTRTPTPPIHEATNS